MYVKMRIRMRITPKAKSVAGASASVSVSECVACGLVLGFEVGIVGLKL